MNSLSTNSLTGAEKSEIMEQVKQQIAVANAQELLTKMIEKCFKKCVIKPGTSLDSTEQVTAPILNHFISKNCFIIDKCVAMCMDRYMDAFHLVFKAYSNRLQRERNRM